MTLMVGVVIIDVKVFEMKSRILLKCGGILF
jgi:hypothetical protein